MSKFAAAAILVSCASAKMVHQKVSYMDEATSTELEGYVAYDDEVATASSPVPAVMIAADWDGLTDHEMNWADRIAALGYVGFAYGVYTPEETTAAEDRSARGALTGKYAGDSDLWRGRSEAGLAFLSAHEAVDNDKIGAIGFCFGGRGVLELARANFPGVHAVVSIHGSFQNPEPAVPDNFDSRVLVLHGGSDSNILDGERGDNSGMMPGLIAELDNVDADWEITKFSGVGHGFTDPSNPAYSEIATERSWESMATFFEDVFATDASDAEENFDDIITEWVDYMDGETPLKGYLAYHKDAVGPLPAVLVTHDWDGITDHELEVAHKLAKEGYVAFANGVFTPEEDDAVEPSDQGFEVRQATTGKYGQNPELHRGRMEAAVSTLQEHEMVHPQKIGAIGFCFGGGSVLEAARANIDGLVAVVSMHGSLTTQMPATEPIHSRVLVLHGAQDGNIIDTVMWGQPQLNSGVLPALEAELSDADASWEVTLFGKTVHSFTEPSAGDNPATGQAYNEMAWERSWNHLTDFLGASFGEEYEYPNPVADAPRMWCLADEDCGVAQTCSDCGDAGVKGARRRLMFGGFTCYCEAV